MPSSLSGGIGIGIGEFGSRLSSSALPTPPYPGLVLWLRGDDAPNSFGMGLAVPLWKDVSGNGNDATQATVASQPTGISNQINGHAAVVFDGVNDGMFTPLNVSSPYTIFMVGRTTNGINGGRFLQSDNQNRIISFNRIPNSIFIGSSVTQDTTVFPGGNWGIGALLESSVAAWFVDGVNRTDNTDFSGVDWGTFVLNGVGQQPEYVQCLIAEILIYPTALVDSPRQTVQAYLGTKYAIALGKPQISLADFSGQSGASMLAGFNQPGLYWSLFDKDGNEYPIWYNVIGEQPPVVSGFLIEVTIPSSANPMDISSATVSAINGDFPGVFTATQVDGSAGAGSLSATQINTVVNLPTTNAANQTTPAAISTIQTGAGNS